MMENAKEFRGENVEAEENWEEFCGKLTNEKRRKGDKIG